MVADRFRRARSAAAVQFTERVPLSSGLLLSQRLRGARSRSFRHAHRRRPAGARLRVLLRFNNTYKILPGVFDIWMGLLDRVPGSVLWLARRARRRRWPICVASVSLRGSRADRLRVCRSTFRCRSTSRATRTPISSIVARTVPGNNRERCAADGRPWCSPGGQTMASRVAGASSMRSGCRSSLPQSLQQYEARVGARPRSRRARRTCETPRREPARDSAVHYGALSR